jgi:hypothetical protein
MLEFAAQLALGLPPLPVNRNCTVPPAPKSQVHVPEVLPMNEPPAHDVGLGVPVGP